VAFLPTQVQHLGWCVRARTLLPVVHQNLIESRQRQGMSNYIRPRRAGAIVFFTVALADRSSHLLVDEIDRLRSAVRKTMRARPVEILAWTVLPNKMHAIWRLPNGDSDYATRWRQIKTRFSMDLPPQPRSDSKVRRNERGIWQRRFWEHHIRGPEDLRTHLKFCFESPRVDGWTDDASSWPYCSRWHALQEKTQHVA